MRCSRIPFLFFQSTVNKLTIIIAIIIIVITIMTGMLAGKMYSHLERKNVLPSEQKGCRKGSRGTKDQLLIDKTVLRDCKKRHNLVMA